MNATEEADFSMLVHGILDGPEFSPRSLQNLMGMNFDSSHEKGDVRYRKKHSFVMQSGSATLTATANSLDERNVALDQILDVLVRHIEAIRACGVTSIGVWIVILKSIQGNWAATPEQVQKLAAVGGSLAVTYYKSTDTQVDRLSEG